MECKDSTWYSFSICIQFHEGKRSSISCEKGFKYNPKLCHKSKQQQNTEYSRPWCEIKEAKNTKGNCSDIQDKFVFW